MTIHNPKILPTLCCALKVPLITLHVLLSQVADVDFKELKAKVKLVVPMKCEARGCQLTEEAMSVLLEACLHRAPLQELQVVYDESGDFDQTALALEHLR